MTDSEFYGFVKDIKPLYKDCCKAAFEYQKKLAMPPDSLGKIQKAAIQLAGITGCLKNKIEKKRIIVLCSDNGVALHGVASAPQSVTASQAVNMTKYKTGMACIAKSFGCEVQVVDVGILEEYECDRILNRKIRHGTNDILTGSAMTRDECLKAIETGIELAALAKKENVSIVGVGEMGIGNTTTSTAVLCALKNISPEYVTGKGGGITEESLKRKKQIISESLILNKPVQEDVIEVISKVGGFDIAAMCGVFLGCAFYRLPVVIDGYISIVAALCAKRICAESAQFFFPSHKSKEEGYMIAAEELEIEPYLNLDMRLGEGSGCPFTFAIVEAACSMMNNMATFDETGINDSYLDEIRKQGAF